MQLKPYGSRILIRKQSDEKIGSIIIPEEAKKVTTRGEVVEVGPECTTAEVGDIIFFGQYAAIEIPTKNSEDLKTLHESDDRDLFVMNECDIICHIVKGEDDAK